MAGRGRDTDLRATLFSSLTGQQGNVSGGDPDDVRGMLLAIGGPAKTKSGINLTSVAQQLGVTRRTVERWVTTAGERNRLRGRNLEQVRTRSRQAATTKAGRRRSMAGARARGVGKFGARLSVRGAQGLNAAGKAYRRSRRVTLDLSPDDVQAAMNAYEQGGDAGYMTWMEQHFSENYQPDWHFDSVDDHSLTDTRDIDR